MESECVFRIVALNASLEIIEDSSAHRPKIPKQNLHKEFHDLQCNDAPLSELPNTIEILHEADREKSTSKP